MTKPLRMDYLDTFYQVLSLGNERMYLNLEEINSMTQKRSPCPISIYNQIVFSHAQKNLDKLKPLTYKNVVLDTVYKI